MRRVLARRDMRLYVAGQTLSMFGDTALWLALAVWAKSLTGTQGQGLREADHQQRHGRRAGELSQRKGAGAGAWLLTRVPASH